MKFLLVKCIETFLIYIFQFLKILNEVIVINFMLENPFHIFFKNLLHGFFLSITYLEIFISCLINIYDSKHKG
jgi:hypothetical protein